MYIKPYNLIDTQSMRYIFDIGFCLYVDTYEVSACSNVRLTSTTNNGYGQTLTAKDFRLLIKQKLIYFCDEKGKKL